MTKRLPVRDRLIETASELFYRQGYNRTGINEILEKSGVAKASMYQHFRSKEEICVEYLKRMDNSFTTALKSVMDKKPSGEDQILGIFDFIHDFFHQEGFRGCWCQNTLSEIPVDDELILGEIRGQKQRFRNYIQDQVKQNIKVTNPEIIADRVYLLFEASLLESQIFMEDWPIREAKNAASAILKELS